MIYNPSSHTADEARGLKWNGLSCDRPDRSVFRRRDQPLGRNAIGLSCWVPTRLVAQVLAEAEPRVIGETTLEEYNERKFLLTPKLT